MCADGARGRTVTWLFNRGAYFTAPEELFSGDRLGLRRHARELPLPNHCQGAIAFTPERAATVMAARRARLSRRTRSSARSSARRARHGAPRRRLRWRRSLTARHRAPRRAACRAAAPAHSGRLLPPPAAGNAAGGEAHAALRALLPSLGGVRLAVTLLAAARGDDANALVAAAAALPRRRAHWSLELEQHFRDCASILNAQPRCRSPAALRAPGSLPRRNHQSVYCAPPHPERFRILAANQPLFN